MIFNFSPKVAEERFFFLLRKCEADSDRISDLIFQWIFNFAKIGAMGHGPDSFISE